MTEVLVDGENGRLVDFFDRDALVAGAIVAALRDPTRGRALRDGRARDGVQRFDLRTRCLPAALTLIRRSPAAGAAQAQRDGALNAARESPHVLEPRSPSTST